MTVADSWLTAFPVPQVAEAVTALCESWRILAAARRPHFHPGIKEPHLTRILKNHVERVTAPERGILGMWAAESVHNETDFHTGKLIDERRTDIVYGWNDKQVGVQLVFEFKKLSRLARSRSQYIEGGLGRFVSGAYARNQPLAVMVGILIDPKNQVIPKLIESLSDPSTVEILRLCSRQDGKIIQQPSRLFSEAKFDTEHKIDAKLSTRNGTIYIAHIFLEFGYNAPR